LLLAAGVGARQIPPGVEARAARWRDYLAGKKVLLVLDDAAGHDQVRPLLPGTAGSLVLITSRRRLAALEDAAAINLDTLTPGEAAELLARLAGRPGLDAGDAEVGEIARLCGYLPLAIGMVASQLRHHPAWTITGLAGQLAAARDRLELMQAEDLSVAAAFELSYRDLPADQRRLFRRLGLLAGPDIDAYAAAALDGSTLEAARRGLEGLYGQHLLSEPAPGRYRLHDLVREHARGLAAAADPGDSGAAADRLLDYYLHTALAASRHIATRTFAGRSPPPGGPPACAPQISTTSRAVGWFEAERSNLHAATEYAAACGRPQHAIAITAAVSGFLRAYGYWDQYAALHQTTLVVARRAGDRVGQADALTQLGILQGVAGDYQATAARHRQALAIYRDIGDRLGQARALNYLGEVQVLTADYLAAAASETEALALARAVGDQAVQADALNDLGSVEQLTGDYEAAAGHIQQALALYQEIGHRWGEADALNHLGVVQRLTGDYAAAAVSQQQSLALFRQSAHRRGQADALNELGLAQQLAGDYLAAAASHQQALDHFRDLGDQLGQAEALNSLGELVSRSSASQQAREHHIQALGVARDLGVPQEEARALEGIGRCHIQDGNPGLGAAELRQALAIYQRIRAPDAQRVQEALRSCS
jgi:tetratricopeptide (TPR) repeat protein